MVFVENTADVHEVVRVCTKHSVLVISFGKATSLEGDVNAPTGGISVDTSRMDEGI